MEPVLGIWALGIIFMFLYFFFVCAKKASDGERSERNGTTGTEHRAANEGGVEGVATPGVAAGVNRRAGEVPRPPRVEVNRGPGANGNVDDVINNLASFKASEKHRALPCAVCLEDLGSKGVSSGQCLHLIHTECLQTWLAKDRRKACPVCRVPIGE